MVDGEIMRFEAGLEVRKSDARNQWRRKAWLFGVSQRSKSDLEPRKRVEDSW